MDRIITGIELGERKLRVAVGRHRPGSTRLIAHMEVPSAGIENDAVVDAHALAASLSGISRTLRMTVDFPLENVVFVVPTGQLQFHETEASVRPSGPRGTVTLSDGEQLLKKSQPAFATGDRRLIHAIPQSYALDGKDVERLPVGKTGTEVSILTMSISCGASTAATIHEAARLAGSETVGLMAGPVAESYAALTEAERERGAALLSVGQRISTVTVMHYGHYLGSVNIGIGAYHFINDLSVSLGVPYPTAEAVMAQIATFSNAVGPARAAITMDEGAGVDINRVDMIATLRDRAEDLFTMTQKAMEQIAGDRELPGGVALAGQPIARAGLAAVARSALSVPIHWAAPRGIEGIALAISDNAAWISAIGTLAWAGTLREPLTHPWFHGVGGGHSGGVLAPWRRLARRLSGRNGTASHSPEGPKLAGNQSIERAARRKNAAVARSSDRRSRRREPVKV